jgi:hypothetical protein
MASTKHVAAVVIRLEIRFSASYMTVNVQTSTFLMRRIFKQIQTQFLSTCGVTCDVHVTLQLDAVSLGKWLLTFSEGH